LKADGVDWWSWEIEASKNRALIAKYIASLSANPYSS